MLTKLSIEFIKPILSISYRPDKDEVGRRKSQSAFPNRTVPPISCIQLNFGGLKLLMKQQAPADVEWDRLTNNLAACLADLLEDEFLVLSSKSANHFVQFAAQGQFGMRIEATSNVYVAPPAAVLSADAYSAMAKLGWKSPTGVPGSEPNDPDGSPNFFLDLALPVDFRRVAAMAVKTLREVYRIQHPGQLQYKCFSGSVIEIRFPTLRLKREVGQSRDC